ncbi:MAG: methyltransferase domain-containing protein [Bacillota bacterium]
MRTVIYPPFIAYHRMFQRPQQLFRHLAKLGYRAVYHDPSRTGRKQPYHEIEPNLFLLSSTAGAASIPMEEPPVLWITYPPYWTLVGRYYQEQLVVFDICDAPAGEFAAWAGDVEPMLERAHVVFCSSQKLYQDYRDRHDHVYLCPNGADYEHFAGSNSPPPPELAHLPRPIIGYHGALAPWLDWELITDMVRQRPGWSFVMVGPPYAMRPEQLPQAPNLVYTGEKEYAELPAYVRSFDAGVMPFGLDDMTLAVDPIKMYEYLAAGCCVVSTPLPQAARCPVVQVAEDAAGFIAAIENGLGDAARKASARSWAESNSWITRARLVQAVLETFLDESAATSEQVQVFDRAYAVAAHQTTAMHRALAGFLLKHCPAETYVEVGAGTGLTSSCLARRARRVAAVDLAPAALCRLKQLRRVEAYRADMLRLPFARGEFEVAWNAGVLEHYEEDVQVEALKELGRVASRHVVVAVPHAGCRPYRLGKLVAEVAGRWSYGEERSYVTLAPQFARAGLELVQEASLCPKEGWWFMDASVPGGREILPQEVLESSAGYLLVSVGRP